MSISRMPKIMKNDLDTICATSICTRKKSFSEVRIVRISNTLDFKKIN